MLVFPSEAGRAEDFANNGMVEAVRTLVDDGRISFFCVDSADRYTWSDNSLSTEERAQRNHLYTRWLEESVVPWIGDQLGGPEPLISLGVSMGAYHAVHFTLTHAEVAPLALGLSGNYDVSSWHGWGERGDATYFANPTDYVAGMHGDHLDWIRSRVSLLLVVGQGAYETHPTGALPSSLAFAKLLELKGIPHQLDLWGNDVAHDWPWWQRQLAHHLPRFC
ncbi:esterase family protein [Luteipulveratus mongoliensis]|uniref:esterase family protein n=1 Tax=Luteipulveratus mongoliensis TaxID=571913 RepID=UPI001FDEBE22|nr:alpha/beta hydrolase-fold protein [Luteipulveratus mongoliensis]